jgi:HAAS domain-containing protein
MNKQAQTVVDGYMRRLKRELRPLPRDRREEILEDIGGHIDESLGQNGSATEADARTLLDQLGEPSEIADEARERFGIPRSKFGVRETLAVILLPFGGFIFGIGWILGVGLLWSSNAWNTREKWIGTLVPPGGLSVISVFFLSAATVGEGGGSCRSVINQRNGHVIRAVCTSRGGGTTLGDVLLVAAFVLVIVLAFAVPIWLAVKARKRAAPAGG